MAIGVVGAQLEVQGLSEPLAIADDGTVVASATLRRLGAPIDAPPQYALLAAGPAGVRIVAGNGPDLDDEQRFDGSNLVGVTADGVAVFNGTRGEGPPVVYAADASGVRKLFGPGTPAPSRTPFRELTGLAVSPNGEVLLRGCLPSAAEYPRRKDCAIYRTLDGRLVRVAGPSQRTDEGLRFDAVEGSVNARGDVLLRATLLPRCNDGSPGLCDGGNALLLLPAGGAVETVHRGYETGYLNGSGAVASFDAPGLVRWQAGVAHTIVTPETAAPNGAAFLDQGLDNGGYSAQCIAADGRVGAFVVASPGGASFVCADGDGLHVIAREGDAPFRDGGYWPSIQCAFADGEVMFLGTAEGVFRASTAAGLERVIGNGDALPDGDAIRARWLGEGYGGGQVFSVNRQGTVATVYRDDDVLLRRPGGAIEVVDLLIDGWSQVSDVFEAEVTSDDSVLATVQYWNDRGWPTGPATRVVHIGPAGVRIIARRGPQGPRPNPAVLDGAPVNLIVADTFAAFSTSYYETAQARLHDLASGGLRDLLDGPYLPARAYVIALADNGDALLETDHYGYGTFYFDGETLQRLSESDAQADRQVDPVALGAPGAVLFKERQRGRYSLSVSAPPATGRCPRLALAPTPSVTPAPTPRPTSHFKSGGGCAVAPARVDGWLLLVLAALVGVRAVARRSR